MLVDNYPQCTSGLLGEVRRLEICVETAEIHNPGKATKILLLAPEEDRVRASKVLVFDLMDGHL